MSRARFSTQVRADLADRVRAAIIGLSAKGVQITLAEATEAALEDWVRQVEADYNDNQPFTPVVVELRRGRRLYQASIPPNSEDPQP